MNRPRTTTKLLNLSLKPSIRLMSQPSSSVTEFETITEGKCSMRYPKGNTVFYNPVQQFNRDISTLGIRAWSELYEQDPKFNKKKRPIDGDQPKPYIDILEALSASGIRAIRYGKEIPNVRKVIANDMSAKAVDTIRQNVEFNEAQDKVIPNQADANKMMHIQPEKAHVIDLDPYGSATPFIDAAVQNVRDNGLLLVTCTDLGILAGNAYPEKCFAQYGGTTVHSDACHESALRLVLNLVASTAAKYGKAIEPVLSLSIDFYVRCFIRVKASPLAVKFNHSKTMIVYHCPSCNSVTPQPLGKYIQRENGTTKHTIAHGPVVDSSRCSNCGNLTHITGPMWSGELHSHEFIDKMLDIHSTLDPETYGTLPRIQGMLALAKSELPDVPFYVSLPSLSHVIKAPCPPLKEYTSALLNLGYQVSETHQKRSCLKTDAGHDVLWDILRAWMELKGEGGGVKEGSPGYKILSKPRILDNVSFEDHEQAVAMEQIRKSKLVRFQMNPTENWGPKGRAH